MKDQIRKVVLAIGAHPDDIEFGSGTTMAKLSKESSTTNLLKDL